MRTLPRPRFSVEEVLLTCISNYRDDDLVTRISNSKDEIKNWSNVLEEKIKTNRVHTIEEGYTPDNLSKNEMIKIYSDKLSKQRQPGRCYYDLLMKSPRNHLCPICGYRPVDSLDHYLPKEKFPIFSITPINLIPACMGCNKKKFTDKPGNAEEEFIHPYFDDIENDLWLYGEIIEQLPLAIYYKVIPHGTWDDIKKERVKKHFTRFKLGQLYSSYASEEVSYKIFLLKKAFEQGGATSVRDELLRELESLRFVYVNSWKTALFAALYESEWFCEEALKYSIDELLK
jgi:hypothetical protein